MDARVARNDEAEQRFFLADARKRLDRWIRGTACYCLFIALCYGKLLTPGSIDLWQWLQPSACWIVVFLPLFGLDVQNMLQVIYLWKHRNYFAKNDPQRHFLICLAECVFRVLLCLHLAFPALRESVNLRVVMLPYVVGYATHFFLGNLAAARDEPRAEGCHTISGLVSELGRFLQFVLVVSVSLKVDEANQLSYYNWKAALWPCWGLEGILAMLLVLLTPVAFLSTWMSDFPRALIAWWSFATAAGLGIALFISMYHLAKLLDDHACPEVPPPPPGQNWPD